MEIFAQSADKIKYSVNYGLTITIWHAIENVLKNSPSIMVTLLAYTGIRGLFSSGVDTESVVECDTFFESTGQRNFATNNEFIDQVINTQSTYNFKKVFEEATIKPEKLIKYARKAGQLCETESSIVWLNLHSALTRKSKVFNWMPGMLAKKFGHFSEDERKVIINEMARCVRNHRSEQLTPPELRHLLVDPREREKFVWHSEMSVMVYQHGAGANVFASLRIPPGLLEYEVPGRKDTRFIYWDANNPITDDESHLHERTLAIKAIQKGIKKDLTSDNPVVDKFFARYTLGERVAVPEMPPLEEAAPAVV